MTRKTEKKGRKKKKKKKKKMRENPKQRQRKKGSKKERRKEGRRGGRRKVGLGISFHCKTYKDLESASVYLPACEKGGKVHAGSRNPHMYKQASRKKTPKRKKLNSSQATVEEYSVRILKQISDDLQSYDNLLYAGACFDHKLSCLLV